MGPLTFTIVFVMHSMSLKGTFTAFSFISSVVVRNPPKKFRKLGRYGSMSTD